MLKYSCSVNSRFIESYESGSIMKKVIEQGNFEWNIFWKHPVYHFCNSLKLNSVILLISLQFITSILASIILKHKSIRLSPILSTSFLVLIKHRYERIRIGNQDENSEKKQLSESRYFPHFISTWHSYTWSIKHTIFSWIINGQDQSDKHQK